MLLKYDGAANLQRSNSVVSQLEREFYRRGGASERLHVPCFLIETKVEADKIKVIPPYFLKKELVWYFSNVF